MSKFDCMEETVKNICDSLENEPEKWVFETLTFKNESMGVEFWNGGFNYTPITDTWVRGVKSGSVGLESTLNTIDKYFEEVNTLLEQSDLPEFGDMSRFYKALENYYFGGQHA